MKNAELDHITRLAEDISQSLPELYVGGDGRFYSTGPNGLAQMDAAQVIAAQHYASKQAHSLYMTLSGMPRRKTAKRL